MADKLTKFQIRGTLVYPKVSRPDTYGEYADNKYKTSVKASAEVAAPIIKAINEFAKSKGIKKFITSGRDKNVPYGEPDDEGNVVFNGKSGKLKDSDEPRQPLLYDAKNRKLPKNVLIGGGTEARVEFAMSYYPREPKKPTGVNFYLNAVQVIDLVAYSSREDSPFEETDGYEADDGAASASYDEGDQEEAAAF